MSTDASSGPATKRLALGPEQRSAARIIGFLYLFQMATGVFGQAFVRDRLIVPGNAAETAQNIIGSERLFRMSIAGDLVTYIGVIVLIWALYVLLRPVDRSLALLAVLFRLCENAVLCVATASSLVALRLLGGADDLKAFEPSQLHSLATLVISAQGLAMSVGFILLGLGSAIFAYLLLKSRYIPKVLAAWGIFASLVLAVVTLANIVFPRLGDAMGMAYMMPMGLYEVGLGLWLLIKGLHAPIVE
ncbi:MAG TPA: DUF4386 domain-containing protein [Usitatibacter sp.]